MHKGTNSNVILSVMYYANGLEMASFQAKVNKKIYCLHNFCNGR